MDMFGYIETNLFCIAVLLVMLVALRTSLSRLTNQTILTHIFVMLMIMLSLDIGRSLVNEAVFAGSDVLNHAFFTAILVTNVLLYFQWFRFVGYNMQYRFWRERRSMTLLALPGLVAIALVAGSLKYGWVYTIDENNRLSSGPYSFVYIGCCTVYMVVSCVLAGHRVFLKRYFADRILNLSLALFGVFTLFGFLLESIDHSAPFSIYAMVVAVLLVFLEMQARMISTDPLTKLNNRNQLNSFLDSKIGQYTENRKVYLFVLDLDKFKGINDSFGHKEGDNALNMVADVLKRVCGPMGCFISRFGGDEFNLVAFLPSDEEAETLKNTVQTELAKDAAELPYKLSVSIGYAASRGRSETVIDLFSRADEALFAEKKSKR